MKAFAVRREDIKNIWHEVEPILRKVEKYNSGEYNMADVCSDLCSGRALLVVFEDKGEYLSCVVLVPRGIDLIISIGCGKMMADWLDLCHETLVTLAISLGFNRLVVDGRKGWVRVLAKFGFKAAGKGIVVLNLSEAMI